MEQERKQMSREDARMIANVFILTLMNKDIKRGVVEYMDCPVCQGEKTVYYTRVIPSGHLRAGCSACGITMMS